MFLCDLEEFWFGFWCFSFFGIFNLTGDFTGTIEEGFIQKKSKSRRCCLGNRIYSIPYRASCFALGRY